MSRPTPDEGEAHFAHQRALAAPGEGEALLAKQRALSARRGSSSSASSYWAEARALGQLAWPVVLTYLLEMSPALVGVMFVGRLPGENPIDAVALGAMYLNVTGLSVGFGFATALDTLCSQAHGAGEAGKLGVYLQRGVVVLSVTFVAIFLVNWHAAELLELVGQPHEVSELAGAFCRVGLLGIPPLLLYELIKKVLQAQSQVMPLLYIALLGNVVNIGACYYLVDVSDDGYLGAAHARNLCNATMIVVLLVYVRFWTNYRFWWRGLTWGAFSGLVEFMRLGVPGMLLLCLEWWAFEVLALFAGWLPNDVVDIGAHIVLLNVSVLTFMFSLGISVASSVRIGNHLGANQPHLARTVSRLSLLIGLALGSVMGLSLVVWRDSVGKVFTNDEAILRVVDSAIPALASYQVFDALNAINSGVLRGSGLQAVGAALNLVAYYVVGLPLAYVFAFKWGNGVPGLWYGMNAALLFYSSLSSTVILRTDWRKRAGEAQSRSHAPVASSPPLRRRSPPASSSV